VIVHLIGPGGAGKTTVGALLARRLGFDFVDLDAVFSHRFGDISDCIRDHGYAAYAGQNVEIYRSLLTGQPAPFVVALSSGFMTYPTDVHPACGFVHAAIAQHPATFVLVPSLDLERCVAETVRRQLRRPFARSAEREEAVIRERFARYVELPARQIETDRPIDVVVDELVAATAGAEL